MDNLYTFTYFFGSEVIKNKIVRFFFRFETSGFTKDTINKR